MVVTLRESNVHAIETQYEAIEDATIHRGRRNQGERAVIALS